MPKRKNATKKQPACDPLPELLQEEKRFGTRLWMARLDIFGRLFPWIGEAIKSLAGLSPDAKLGIGGTDEANRAYLVAHDEYAKGYRSDRPEVRAIHDRQNAEWEELTGIPPLGKIADWHAAAAAAGMQGFHETDVQTLPIRELEKIILPWALAKQSTRQRVAAETSSAAPVAADIPSWNKDTGKLSFRGQVVREIRCPGQAINVVRILDAFEEENWPTRIDDPIPGDNSTKFHDTLDSLRQGLSVIHFRADGTGEGIVWEIQPPASHPEHSLNAPGTLR